MLQARYPQVDPFEAALINNLGIDTAQEARSLIPSIRDKFKEDTELDEFLRALRQYQSA